MNGAALVPPSSTSTPSSTSITTIGVSHHFLLWRRKSNSSRTNPGELSSARVSNSDLGMASLVSVLPEVALHRGLVASIDPVGLRLAVEPPAERVAPREAQREPDRRQNQIVNEGE